ncbi:response regulator transcription factor [Dongia sp. agr-C8]
MTATVCIVDDDEAVRDSLAFYLRMQGIAARVWDSAEAFLADARPAPPACLLLDIRMAGMNGLELFDSLIAAGSSLPVIFLTGHADVPMAVSALKKGAFDFIEKPYDQTEILRRLQAALEYSLQRQDLDASRATVAARLKTLSERERQVMELLLQGKMNKVIAADLGIAVRTVEMHRGRVLEKMGVRSAVELAQRLAAK